MTLDELIKTQDKTETERFTAPILESLSEVVSLLQKVLEKPAPKLELPLRAFTPSKEVEFPAVQKVEMEKPDWYEKDEPAAFPDLAKPIADLAKTIVLEGEKTRAILFELLDKKNEEKPEPEAKTVNTGAVRSRRTTQWKIATFPQQAGTSAITSAGDGVTYYLPSACIPNSETIRLNGGLPLSHGVDYTLSGNRVVYQQDQSNSQQEIRYQTK